MEVASPLALAPAPASASRCSPMMDNKSNKKRAGAAACLLTSAEQAEHHQRSAKRRRFAAMDVDSLSEDFSSHSIFYTNSGAPTSASRSMTAAATAATPTLKRLRSIESTAAATSRSNSPARDELNRVVQEQASLIESLKKDKSGLEDSLKSLQTDHHRVVKENGILRKAITIQQERQTAAETETAKVQQQADERIKGLEQMILQLRYHLQAHQKTTLGNDFMHPRPPDVY